MGLRLNPVLVPSDTISIRYNQDMEGNRGSRAQRKLARRSWPVRRFELGSEPDENLSASTTAEERLAMMWELSRQAWALSGRPSPAYDRSEAPGRVVRASQ
jgi:hypothetical protein